MSSLLSRKIIAKLLKWQNYQKAMDLSLQFLNPNLNQSVPKKINPEYSLDGPMLKLKLQYFGQLVSRADSLEKTLILGNVEAGGEGTDRGWDGWMALSTQLIWVWANSRRHGRTGKPGMLQSMVWQRVRHYWVTEQQQSCEVIDKLTKLIIVLIILQYIHISKHRVVHLKLRCYISTTA